MDLEGINPDNIPEDELDEVLKELESLLLKTPLDYVPHDKQKQFHTATNKIRFLCGGNRSGKTEAGGLEALFHATGLYPEWYPKNRKFKGPTKGRIIVTDYKNGGGVIESKLLNWLPPELMVGKPEYLQGKYLSKLHIKHKSGGISEIEILTHEQDDMVFESWNGHWAWFDEPPPRDKFMATLRGLIDYRGICWLTLTPINQPWLYDEFITKNENDEDIFYLSVDIRDNPHIPEEEIEKFEKRLTDDEKEARLHGKFKHLTGMVYKIFDRNVHVIPESKFKRESNWPVFFVIDPADRRPHHGIWATIDPFGTIFVFKELVFKGTILETSKEILKRELMDKIDPLRVIRIIDPNKGNSPSLSTGLKLRVEFASHAIYFVESDVNDDLTTGHLAVSERLSWDRSKEVSTTNHPKLYFVKENTKECVRQLSNYIWDEWLGRAKDTRAQKETPKDINKDMPDCVRYLVMSGPQFFVHDDSDPQGNFSSVTGY